MAIITISHEMGAGGPEIGMALAQRLWQQGRMTWTEQEAGVWTCILRTSSRRAWLTLSMCLETALRHPRVIRHAFTLSLMHKHFYEYVRDTSRELETLICDLREWEPAAPGATAVEPQYR